MAVQKINQHPKMKGPNICPIVSDNTSPMQKYITLADP